MILNQILLPNLFCASPDCLPKKLCISNSLFDNKKGSKPRKTCSFIRFSLIFFANAQQAQVLTTMTIEQPCEPTPEVFGLLPPTLLHCLITKMAQNQEKCPFLLVFRYYFLLTLNILKL